MKQMWSPWRSSYVETLKHTDKKCVFCEIDKLNQDEKTFVIARQEFNYVVLNIFPYNNGHLLVVPYEHVDDTTILSEDVLNEAMRLIQYSIKALRNVFSADGFNVGMNLGSAAGAGIAEHIHFHIVPRWKGDTNFMPVLSGNKVISQDLKTTFDKIKPEFEKFFE